MVELYIDGLHRISNPYVLRLDFQHIPIDDIHKAYRQIVKFTKKIISNTSWGYSAIHYDSLYTRQEHEFENRICAYWVFAAPADALVFRLQYDKTLHVEMWPKDVKFNVYCITE